MNFAIDLKTGKLNQIDVPVMKGKKTEDRISKLSLKYSIVRTTALSEDGTDIPISIVFNNQNGALQTPAPCPGPLVLVAYGAYGVSVPVEFDPQIFALLERGFTVAYAHCRGGGEYGAVWHKQGRGHSKWNTCNDYTSCAQYLISKEYTSPSMLCGMGSSAGGLIMGVMANESPNMFAALVMR